MEVDVDASEVEQVVPVQIVKRTSILLQPKRRPVLCVAEVGVQRWFTNQRILELHILR